jgi:two-component system, NtrC family, sensor kinase
LIEAHNRSYGNAKISILLADAHFQRKEYQKSETLALHGLALADSIGTRELIQDAFGVLHKIYASINIYDKAYDYLANYISVRDSIVNESTAKSFTQMESGYEIAKKQNEILLLENIAKNRAILLRATIIIGVLALLLAVVFYNKQQVKHKANQKLEAAYSELEHTQKQLMHQEKLASLGQLTAGIAHEIKNPLNFVNNFSQVSVEMIKEFKSSNNETDRNAILNDLEVNLEKIAAHGSRANSIVDRMLDHSRTGEQVFQATDLLKLCEEYFNLAYQAARIKNQGFKCKFSLTASGQIPKINVATQEISRVLLNIFNNCIYAVSEKMKTSQNYHPEIVVKASSDQQMLTLTIGDNGPGIPDHVIEKIFQPFFTTKPPGEGTGLGLSLSYDIILSHQGTIRVANANNGGAEFTIVLPLNLLNS